MQDNAIEQQQTKSSELVVDEQRRARGFLICYQDEIRRSKFIVDVKVYGSAVYDAYVTMRSVIPDLPEEPEDAESCLEKISSWRPPILGDIPTEDLTIEQQETISSEPVVHSLDDQRRARTFLMNYQDKVDLPQFLFDVKVKGSGCCKAYNIMRSVIPDLPEVPENAKECLGKIRSWCPLPLGGIPSLEVFVRAFKLKHINRGVPERLRKHLVRQLKIWKKSKHYSPYITVCNSSGLGKSRAICELADTEGKFVCYVCFREHRTGYPNRTNIFADELQYARKTEFIAFMIAIMKELIKQLKSSNKVTKQRIEDDSKEPTGEEIEEDSREPTGEEIEEDSKEPTEEEIEEDSESSTEEEIEEDSESSTEEEIEEDSRELTPSDWLKQQTDASKSKTFWTKIKRRYDKLLDIQNFGKYSDEHINDYAYLVDGSPAIACQMLVESHNKLRKALKFRKKLLLKEKKQNKKGNNQPLMIFAFDEARSLIPDSVPVDTTPFYFLRLALRELPDKSQKGIAIGILVDTSSKVSNFSAPAHRDPSERVRLSQKKLFPPFCAFPNTDIHFDGTKGLTLEKMLVPSYIRCFGRPLWFVGSQDSHNDLIRFAASKLLHKYENLLAGSNTPSVVEMGSILGPRFALDVNPQKSLSEELVANYMRPLVGISDDRNCVYSEYFPEPVLSEVSAIFSHFIGYPTLLRVLLNAVRENQVDTGFWGELVGRILILMAWDQACRSIAKIRPLDENDNLEFYANLGKPTYFVTLPVLDFLKKLLPRDFTKSKLYNDKMARFVDYYVRCIQFVPLRKHTPSNYTLLECFARATGVVCKPYQRGIDLIIPMVRIVGSAGVKFSAKTAVEKRQSILKNRIKAKHVSHIAIQVENRQTLTAQVCASMHPRITQIEQNEDLDFISILMSLGGKHDESVCASFAYPIYEIERKVQNLQSTKRVKIEDNMLCEKFKKYLEEKQVCISVDGLQACRCLKPDLDELLVDKESDPSKILGELLCPSGLDVIYTQSEMNRLQVFFDQDEERRKRKA